MEVKFQRPGRVAELVYAADLKSVPLRVVGSSPTSPTTVNTSSDRGFCICCLWYDWGKNMAQKITASKAALRGYRTKKLPEYSSFKVSRRIKPDRIKKLPPIRQLWRDTWQFIWLHRLKMLTFSLFYAAAYLVLVKGFNGFTLDVDGIKGSIPSLSSGYVEFLLSLASVYASLIASFAKTSNEAANFFQASIVIVSSLAFIWLLRKLHSKDAGATVKQAFYLGSQPLVPFVLVLLILVLQLLPAGFGGLLLATAQSGGALGGSGEVAAFSLVALLLLVLSTYLITGSFFALYIVTLPGTDPIVAVRSSLHLLRVHRWHIVWRLFVFMFWMLLIGLVLSAPSILWLPKYVEVIFFMLGMLTFVVTHTYVYKLYRSML